MATVKKSTAQQREEIQVELKNIEERKQKLWLSIKDFTVDYYTTQKGMDQIKLFNSEIKKLHSKLANLPDEATS